MFTNVVLASVFVINFGVFLSAKVDAQTIHLKTENYPPFNMSAGDNEIIGIATDIVEQLFDRAGVDYDIELLPWQRAFGMALEESNTAVFSTTRTAEREPKFKWVGPLVENNWVLLAKQSSNITISNLEDAKSYRVGGYQGDAVALYLADKGFDMDLTSRDELNALKIERDRIDFWATGHLLGPYYAKNQNVHGLVPVLTFRKTIMSIAFNINANQSIIEKLNAELAKMKSEGLVNIVEQKYQ